MHGYVVWKMATWSDFYFSCIFISGFLLILLIESVVHKFFGGHGHSHFPSQETLANRFVGVEVSWG